MNPNQRTPLIVCLYRILRLFCWLMALSWRVSGFGKLSPNERHQAMQQPAARLLDILHIHIDVSCHAQYPSKPPVLTVSNHVSWLDIFVLMALYPSGFIAKQSIRHWPLVGTLAERIGTVFINRYSRQDAGTVSQTIATALAAEQSVTFFPEARTSDGFCVLPFKAALFQAAIDTCTPVQAVAIRYYTPAGIRCADAAWVGKTSFYASLWRIARQAKIRVQVDLAPPMDAEFTCHADRFQLKEAAEQFIRHKVCQP